MTDYTKLVEALRRCAEPGTIIDECDTTDDCPYSIDGYCGDCMNNLVKDAAAAIEELENMLADECKECDYLVDENARLTAENKELQAELNSRTIYDYPVDKLIMFAEMCKRNDVQDRDLKQAAWNLELAVRAVMNERQEIIKNAVGEITMRCTPDFEKAFKEMRDGAKKEVQDEQK